MLFSVSMFVSVYDSFCHGSIYAYTLFLGRPRVDSWYSAHSRRSAYFSTGGSSYQSTTDSGLGNFGHQACFHYYYY